MKLNSASVNRVTAISPVWIVPIVSLLIAAWLAFQAHQNKGAIIEISFTNASDIIPNQTQIRLKDVHIGGVTQVKLSDDLKTVKVIAEVDRDISKHLSEHSRFWVVTPRISATGVSNLGTLISGVYIVMDPGEPGRYTTKFNGLESPPSFQSDDKGTQFVLQAKELGSLDIGSPIYYRQVRVGEVTSYKLSDNNNHVDVNIFIRAPYNSIIQTRSRFWNVSGFGVTVGADGVKAQMASVASLISGGIAFDNAAAFENAEPAKENDRFFLYDDRESVQEGQYDVKVFYRLRFDMSVRGLTVGAPVEFRGIYIGEVVSVALDTSDIDNHTTLVYIAMEPQRLEASGTPTREEVDNRMSRLVDQGLRAHMKTSSLLTGAKYIDLVINKKIADRKIANKEIADKKIADQNANTSEASLFRREANYSVIPTASQPDDIGQEVASVIARVEAIPIEQIGQDLGASMQSLKTLLQDLEQNRTTLKVDSVLAKLDDALGRTQSVLSGVDNLVGTLDDTLAPDSETKYALTNMLKSVSDAATSADQFMQELTRNPNVIITGVEKDDDK